MSNGKGMIIHLIVGLKKKTLYKKPCFISLPKFFYCTKQKLRNHYNQQRVKFQQVFSFLEVIKIELLHRQIYDKHRTLHLQF